MHMVNQPYCDSVLSISALGHKPEIISLLHQSLSRDPKSDNWRALMRLRRQSAGEPCEKFTLEALLNQSFDLSDNAKKCVQLLIDFGGMEIISKAFYHKIVSFNSANGNYFKAHYDYPALDYAKNMWIRTKTNFLNMLNNGYSFGFIDKIAGHSFEKLSHLPLRFLVKTFDAFTLSKAFHLNDIRKQMPLSRIITSRLHPGHEGSDAIIDDISEQLIAANITTKEEVGEIESQVKEQIKRKSAFMPISSNDL